MKYIALDIGNVICDADLKPFINDVSETFNVSLHEATVWLKSFQQIHDIGLTTMEQQLRENFNCRSEVTIKKLSDRWSNQIQPYLSMVTMLDELIVKHDTKVALLSNIGIEHAAQMSTKLYPLLKDDRATVTHFSCDVGARKPTLLYYQSFLMQYPEFKGCLYVDDLHENLATAKKLGFQPHHFTLDADKWFKVPTDILEIEKIIKNSNKSTDI